MTPHDFKAWRKALGLSQKKAADALHNLTTILADDSTGAKSFAAGALNYTASGLPAKGGTDQAPKPTTKTRLQTRPRRTPQRDVTGDATGSEAKRTSRRAEKIGVVASDKMEKTCVVRVDRLIKHPKYRRYVRRTSKFMAHNEQGATVGDKVRIVETRPLSAHKRWRVVEIIQKAEK